MAIPFTLVNYVSRSLQILISIYPGPALMIKLLCLFYCVAKVAKMHTHYSELIDISLVLHIYFDTPDGNSSCNKISMYDHLIFAHLDIWETKMFSLFEITIVDEDIAEQFQNL